MPLPVPLHPGQYYHIITSTIAATTGRISFAKKAFNRTYQRTGALFQRPFGRIPITSDAYFVQLIAYIHRNLQKHGFVKDFREWPYSSYHAHLSTKPTHLKRDAVLSWFNGAKQFADIHWREFDETPITALVADDFD